MSGLEVVELAWSSPVPHGRPIVFIHGFSHNRSVWASLAGALGRELRPLLVDLRGHGDSGWSAAASYAVEDYAGDLPRALDAIGVERAIVVGHSLGGQVATLLAAQHPDRVEALVLVDTGPGLSLPALTRIASDVGGAFDSFESLAAYRSRLAAIHPLCDPQQLAAFAERSVVRRVDGRFEAKLDPGVLQGGDDAGRWAQTQQRLAQALGEVCCPTLLVRGGLSAVLSEQLADEISSVLLRDGRLRTIERAGHAVMLDDAPAFQRVLEEFIGTLPAAARRQVEPATWSARPAPRAGVCELESRARSQGAS